MLNPYYNNKTLSYNIVSVSKELFDNYFEKPNVYRDAYHAGYDYIKNNVDEFKDSISDED